MRTLRLFLYFLVGLFLGGWGVLANAETIAATYTTTRGSPQATVVSACQSSWSSAWVQINYAAYQWVYYDASGSSCRAQYVGSGGSYGAIQNFDSAVAGCPVGQNWTLNGASCTRPDCPVGVTRDPATGLCPTACAVNEVLPGYYSVPWTTDIGIGGYCIAGCRVYGPFGDLVKNGVKDGGGTVTGQFANNGDTCTSSPVTPSQPATPKSDPPCAAGDGVIQYPDKTVKCVSPGVPGATVPPVVKTDDKKTTYPDGSTSNTTVTQTCTGQGACSTTTITTVTGVGGVPNGPAGQAGTPGTTTGAGMSSTTGGTDQQSDFCAKNPSSQICKGGMNEEATQRHILTEVYKLTDMTGEAPDVKDLSDAGKKPLSDFAAKGQDGKDALTRQEETIADYATGKKSDPLTNEKRSAWSEAMNSGWFDKVPQSGCEATDAKIGPFNWHFDICPVASKISEIGAYAMWFMLAVGTFVMVTGGRKE